MCEAPPPPPHPLVAYLTTILRLHADFVRAVHARQNTWKKLYVFERFVFDTKVPPLPFPASQNIRATVKGLAVAARGEAEARNEEDEKWAQNVQEDTVGYLEELLEKAKLGRVAAARDDVVVL